MTVPSSRLFVLIAALTFAASCRGGRDASPQTPPPNIVLITIDTLRADRIGRGFTPAIDALAARGTRFMTARSAVPLTLPSHVTMMTGQLPTASGVHDNGVVFTPQPAAPTLARRFRDAGMRTGAFVGAYVLDRRFGLADGFDTYDDRVRRDPNAGASLEAERRGAEVADAAIAWLHQQSSRFFLWVHLYDPHAPYDPPQEYLAKAGGNPYDGEVAYADAQVARVVEALRARGVAESTLIVVAGDHGEGLGEHGEHTHGMLLFDSTLRVPLIFSGASVPKSVVAAPVSLADVASTLAHAAGLSAAGPAANLLAPQLAERDVYSETRYPLAAGWHDLTALAGERWKLVRAADAQLYDLSSDPGEMANVAGANPGIVQGMLAQLTKTAAASATPSATVDAEAAERLRALGYVSGSSALAGSNPRAPNPSQVIAAWAEFEVALAQLNAGRAKDAVPALKALAEKFPDGPVFLTTYGRALKDAGRPADAVAVYKEAATRVRDAGLFHDLAIAARAAGNTSEAMNAERAALALEAKNPAALNGLGLLQAEAGKPADAAALFEQAAGLDRSNASYWTNLGNARRELSQWSEAEAAYRHALDVDAGFPDAANGLGTVLVQTGKPADAVALFERALAAQPDLYEARLNLGIALQESGQRERAAAAYREVLAKAPARFARERRAAADLLRQIAK